MLSLITGPLGKLAAAALLLAALWGSFHVWLASHDRAITEALVSQFEKTAADAKAVEQKRQADAAKAATANFQKQLADAKAAEAKANADLTKGLSDYETKLADAKRLCSLSDDDIDAIVHIGSAKAAPVGHH